MTKKCPYCKEIIKREAMVCRYCGKELSEKIPNEKSKPFRFKIILPEKSANFSAVVKQLTVDFGITSDEGTKYLRTQRGRCQVFSVNSHQGTIPKVFHLPDYAAIL